MGYEEANDDIGWVNSGCRGQAQRPDQCVDDLAITERVHHYPGHRIPPVNLGTTSSLHHQARLPDPTGTDHRHQTVGSYACGDCSDLFGTTDKARVPDR